jgi:hypothetical protein
VGTRVREWLKSTIDLGTAYEDAKFRRCLQAESYLTVLEHHRRGEYDGTFPLANLLRQKAGTLRATSWDDFWSRAAPVLRGYWDAKEKKQP